MKDKIVDIITKSIAVKELVRKTEIDNIEKAVRAIVSSLKSGGKLVVFGNGGSAADSQHIAAELVGRFKMERKPIPAISLTCNTSTITAISNDYGYETSFSRELEALGRKGDVALGISTSGNSKNVLGALKKAKSIGMVTIGLLGGNGGIIKESCDIMITIPSFDTPRVQESHIMTGHIICELIEEEMSG